MSLEGAHDRPRGFFMQVISPWRCVTGCGIGPLNHRFTPKVVQKGVSAGLQVSERQKVITSLCLLGPPIQGEISRWREGKTRGSTKPHAVHMQQQLG